MFPDLKTTIKRVNVKSSDFLCTLLINKIKENVPEHKQERIMRRMGLEESIVEKLQKRLCALLAKFKTNSGKPKQSEQEKSNKTKSKAKAEKRVTRGALQRLESPDKVSNSNDNDDEDDDEDDKEERRRKKKGNIAPVSSDTSAEETASDVETDEDETDGEYVKKRFEKNKVFVHFSIKNPKLKKPYWCSTERRNQTKDREGKFRKRTSCDPPDDGFVWILNQTFYRNKGSAPERKFNPSTRKTKKFRKYTWGHYQIDKKYVCSEEGCKAKKITTKPEHYKGKTLLYLTIYKRLHNHSEDPNALESKRGRESSDSIEEERRKKKEKISQNISKRKIQSSSSKGEDSTNKKQSASKKKPSKRRKESIIAISKQLFSGPSKKDDDSNQEGMTHKAIGNLSDSFEKGFKDLSDNSSINRKESKKDSLSDSFAKDLKISGDSSGKETIFSPVQREKKQKRTKKESNLDRLTKRFESQYEKNDPTLFQSGSSDSSSQKKGNKFRVSEVFTPTSSSDDNSDKKLFRGPVYKSTPISSPVETDEDSKNTYEKKTKVEKHHNEMAGIGICTQKALFAVWSEETNCEAKQSVENDVKSSKPGNTKNKSTPINSRDIALVSKNLTKHQVPVQKGEKHQHEKAEIGICTQKELFSAWNEDSNCEAKKAEENEVKSSQPGNPKHKSTPINSSDITEVSKNLTEHQSSKIISQEIMSPVFKSSRKRDFKTPSILNIEENPQGTLTDKTADAKTETLPLVDTCNENSYFDLSPPRHEDCISPDGTKDESFDNTKLDELMKKWREIEATDDNLDEKAYKALLLKQTILKEKYCLDKKTPGDNQCFFHALIQQAMRPEVFSTLSANLKALLLSKDALKVRTFVVDFMEYSEDERMVAWRRSYEIFYESLEDKTNDQSWQEYLKDMRKKNTWADNNVLQATSFLLNLDMYTIAMNSRPNEGTVFRSKENVDVVDPLASPLSVPFIFIANYDQRHYQSLLPIEDKSSTEDQLVNVKKPQKPLFYIESSSTEEDTQQIQKLKRSEILSKCQTPDKATKEKVAHINSSTESEVSEDLKMKIKEYEKKVKVVLKATGDNLALKAYEAFSVKLQVFEIPLRLDKMTPATELNFFQAIIQQGMRPEVFHTLSEELKEVMKANDIVKLQSMLYEFMINNQENQNMIDLRRRYKEDGLEQNDVILFALSYLLDWDVIKMTLSSSNADAEIYSRHGSDESVDWTMDRCLIIGFARFSYANNDLSHWQSLLPNYNELRKNRGEDKGSRTGQNKLQINKERQTPKNDSKGQPKGLHTAIDKESNKLKVFVDEKFTEMREEPNSMYIFNDLKAIKFGRGSKYPAVNRLVHKWATHAHTQKKNYPVKFKCNGLEKEACKATRKQYYCENNKCRKPQYEYKCCKSGTAKKKLVVVFEGTHQCSTNKKITEEEIEKNLEDYYKDYNLIPVGDELPSDLNGNKIYRLPLKPENEKSLADQVKCGRRFGKFKTIKKLSREEKNMFGPHSEENLVTKKKADCRGYYKCRNMQCPYFERFNAINQVRISKSRQHKCSSCDEELFNAKCTATKTLLINELSNSLVVIHEGSHNHKEQKKISIDVINLVKEYFKNRPDTNRTMATNDLIASAIMNNKDIVEDILILYSREDEFKKIRDEARKSLLNSKHGTFSSVNEFLKKYEGNKWGLHNYTGSHAKYCPSCKEKTFDDEHVTHCAKCQNVPLKDVGEIIFQTTDVGMELLAQAEEGKSHDIECLFLGKGLHSNFTFDLLF